jgi:hypothetical protein
MCPCSVSPKHFVTFNVSYRHAHYRNRIKQTEIALLILYLGARREWVVSTTPRPLYPRERLGTHFTGGLVGHKAV